MNCRFKLKQHNYTLTPKWGRDVCVSCGHTRKSNLKPLKQEEKLLWRN